MKLRLGHDISALALDRLDDDAGDFIRRHEVHEDLAFEKVEALRLARLGLQANRAAVAVAVRCVESAGLHRTKPAPLDGLARCQRERAERAAMEAAEKRDHAVPLRYVTRQLDRGLDRFRS